MIGTIVRVNLQYGSVYIEVPSYFSRNEARKIAYMHAYGELPPNLQKFYERTEVLDDIYLVDAVNGRNLLQQFEDSFSIPHRCVNGQEN